MVTEAVLNAISQLTIMEELDEQPMEEQPSKAINCPSAGKATGEDGISPEAVKHGKEALISDLHELLYLCWTEGSIP